MSKLHIIKGAPIEQWENVQAIQHEPFIYIQSNGSKWAGESPDNIEVLLEVLSKYNLDLPMFSNKDTSEYTFITENPHSAKFNPDYPHKSSLMWINDKPLYNVPVVSFFGNFEDISHVFSITTNHQKTIALLTEAINANILRQKTPHII